MLTYILIGFAVLLVVFLIAAARRPDDLRFERRVTISAPAAAYRSKRQWYAVSFNCTVAPDYGSVTNFSFKVGASIPRSEWESHYLNPQDENE